MSLILKVGAGMFAGVVAGGLGFLFWPHLEPGIVASRSAVEKPVFVVAKVAGAQGAAPAPAIAAPALQVPDKANVEKLAAALKQDVKPIAGANAAADVKVTPVVALAAKPAPVADPKPATPNEVAARLFAHGLVALADGDLAGARLYLQRAADAGDARALMALGDSYDAPTLARLGVVGAKGDAAKAHDFYQKAVAAGVGAAKDRIAELDAKPN